jgi:hypothetical protein
VPRRLLLSLPLLAALLFAPARAAAHLAPPPLAAAAQRAALGPGAERLPSGLYRVPVGAPGSPAYLLSHGPDPAPAVVGSAGPLSGFAPGAPERWPLCAGDHTQRFLYAHLAGQPDRLGYWAATLRAQIRRADAVLDRESLASGGPSADYRVACDPDGEISLASIAVSDVDFSSVVAAARAAGFSAPGTDYSVFVDDDSPSWCGLGSFHRDEQAGAANASLPGADYAIVYRDCWYGSTLMHENGHNQGAVQYGAPHSTGSGDHCWQAFDVMCYSPDGGDLHQQGMSWDCLDYQRFDCGYDDYFDSAPSPGSYLATHWNIGDRALNPFLAFGAERPERWSPERPERGVWLAGQVSARPGSFHHYRLRLRRGTRRLQVELRRPGCSPACGYELALYLRSGARPTAGSRRCRRLEAGRWRCRISRPRRGSWYLGVRTLSGAAGAPYKLRAAWR